jgi:hypothetical protein
VAPSVEVDNDSIESRLLLPISVLYTERGRETTPSTFYKERLTLPADILLDKTPPPFYGKILTFSVITRSS